MTAGKKKRRLCATALRNTELSTAYHALDLIQAPFGFVFSLIEQRKAKLQDRIDNERRSPL
jgi:hypothetical protein